MDALELLEHLDSYLANSFERKWLASLVEIKMKSFTQFFHYDERVTLVLDPRNVVLTLRGI